MGQCPAGKKQNPNHPNNITSEIKTNSTFQTESTIFPDKIVNNSNNSNIKISPDSKISSQYNDFYQNQIIQLKSNINDLQENNNKIFKECEKYKNANLELTEKLKVNENLITQNKQKEEGLKNQIIQIKEQNEKRIKEKDNYIAKILKENKDEIDEIKTQMNGIKTEKMKNEEDYRNQINKIKQEKEQIDSINKQNQEQLTQNESKINLINKQLEKEKAKVLDLEKQLGQEKTKVLDLEKQLKQTKRTPKVGLDNIGATCYMNATLQSLSNTPGLSDYFLDKNKKIKEGKSNIISNEYYTTVQNLWDFDKDFKSFPPNSFKKVLSQLNPLFQGIAANDSKDLINFLLERFHQELNMIDEREVNIRDSTLINQADQLDENKMLNIFLTDFKVKFHSIISDLFYGVMETKSQCQGCNNIKYNFQVYSFLEFPLEQVNKYCFNKGLRNNYLNTNINPDVDLYECFNYYSNMEMMTGENQMYCNICNKSCDALYGTNLYSAPNYLIINLNIGKGAVYQCNVIFPEKLNILNFVSFKEGNTYFELYAVICHIGPSSMSGHFVAYCKDKIDKKWYLFNDSSVTPCKKKDEYKNGMPYILFYQAL